MASLILERVGSSSKPVSSGVANHNFKRVDTKTYATSGDCRQSYLKQTFAAAGSGEVARIYAVASGTGVATGGTVNAVHATLSVTGTVSGAGNAIRATIGCAASATPGGTTAALQIDSDIGGSATVSNMAGIRFTKSGSTDLPFAFAFDDDQATKGSTATSADGIKIRWHDGTTKYIMVGS